LDQLLTQIKKAKLSLSVPLRHAAVDTQPSSLLTSALDGDKWSTSHPGCPGGKNAQYSLNRRLYKHHRQSGHF